MTLKIDLPNRLEEANTPVILAGYYQGPHALIEGWALDDSNRQGLFRAMRDAGCNLIRCIATGGMAYEDNVWAHPYQRSGSGKTRHASQLGKSGRRYDLDSWNAGFFDRWGRIISDAEAFDLYLQIALLEGAHTQMWEIRGGGPERKPFRDIGLAYDYLHEGNSAQGVDFQSPQDYYGHSEVRRRHRAFITRFVGQFSSSSAILWEVINEGQRQVSSYRAWESEMIDAVRAADSTPGRLLMPVDLAEHRDHKHKIPGSEPLTVDRMQELYTAAAGKSSGEVVLLDDDCCFTSASPRDMALAACVAYVAGGYPSWMHFEADGLDSRTRSSIEGIGGVRRFLIDQEIDLSGMEPRNTLVEVLSGGPAWCLAREPKSYLIFLPEGGQIRVRGARSATALDPTTGAQSTREGENMEFSDPALVAVRGDEPTPCVSSDTRLCLFDGQFEVSVAWEVPEKDQAGEGHALEIVNQSGGFWFFNRQRAVVDISIDDGRAINGFFWVFVAATTDVVWEVVVRRVATGQTWRHRETGRKPVGIRDSEAFRAE